MKVQLKDRYPYLQSCLQVALFKFFCDIVSTNRSMEQYIIVICKKMQLEIGLDPNNFLQNHIYMAYYQSLSQAGIHSLSQSVSRSQASGSKSFDKSVRQSESLLVSQPCNHALSHSLSQSVSVVMWSFI